MNVKSTPNKDASITPRLISITEAMVYLGIGKSTATKYLDKIGAKRKIGKRTLYDRFVIDQHLNKKGEVQVE